MKKLQSYSFLVLFVLALFSCDVEPLEGEFSSTPDGTDPQEFCQDILLTISAAQLDLAFASPENQADLCDALRGTIQQAIDICGDPGNGFQMLLDELGNDCSIDTSCSNATTAANVALDAFNNASTEDQETLCPALVMTLEAQIQACGDDDGSIQTTIDGLPCS